MRIENRSGQSPGMENVSGIDPRIFNVIFTLLTGSPTLGSGHKALLNMDIWDYEPGLNFFGDILFNNGYGSKLAKAYHMKAASK